MLKIWRKKMGERGFRVLLLAGLLAGILTGCGTTETVPEAQTPETEAADEKNDAQAAYEAVDIRVGSLKGPTSMGLVALMEKAENGEAANRYTFTMETGADALVAMMAKGDLDIALLPANVAAALYQKTQGGIYVLDINTLGVLYMVSGSDPISSFSDLKGKTIYLTGKGTTPDYCVQYLLGENGLTTEDVRLEYKSEASEVAALLAKEPESIGVLPQPFVTAACAQNEALKIVMDLNAEWDRTQEGQDNPSRMVTGVTVVRKEFLVSDDAVQSQKNEKAVLKFLEEQKASVEFANANIDETAELVAKNGIIEKAPVAKKALPNCNLVCIDGEEMQAALSGYLKVLYELDPKAVGGKLPEDDFYRMSGAGLQ